jgi:hypothetical protein
MTKGERLIWDLFMKVREVLPATADNSRWATDWAAVFHQMEHPEPEHLPGQGAVEPEHLPQPSADDDDDDSDDDDVPHVRAAPKRRRK